MADNRTAARRVAAHLVAGVDALTLRELVTGKTIKGVTMCFENLYESSKRGELTLIDGGLCHWHLRRDGQITIREIVSQRSGAGREMLLQLMAVPGATCIVAKCPQDLMSNDWYRRQGFTLNHTEQAKSGRGINVWRLELV